VPQFRFLYHTSKFDETVAFWAEQVGLDKVGGWGRAMIEARCSRLPTASSR
jgi:hypothetical protein